MRSFDILRVCAIGLAALYALLASSAGHAASLQALLAPGTHAAIDGVELDLPGLNAFYRTRHYRAAWDFAGSGNARAFQEFLSSMELVIAYHGLDPSRYPIESMRRLIGSASEDDADRLEILVSNALLRLAHDLHGDSEDLGRIYTGWTFRRQTADIPLMLAGAVATGGLKDLISALAPPNPAYGQLATTLRTYRKIAASGGWKPVAPGPALKPGKKGPRVMALRARLAAENYMPGAPPAGPMDVYDESLGRAVADWQKHNGLDADGHAGLQTLAALNEGVERRIERVRANMERWRHMPESWPPGRYVAVNIADASVAVVEDGKAAYEGPVVVGRVDRRTPFIDSVVRSAIINPSWHVPLKIAQKDILPKLREDPRYLEKMGIIIRGEANDPYGEKIDWKSVPENGFRYRLRQVPGDINSLGQLKFDFDNPFSVYMHGTPHQDLFGKSARYFSSGCIRLRDPEEVGAILLAPNGPEWDAGYIDDQIEQDKTRWVELKEPMPIYAVYWTVFMDEDGGVNFRPDIYGYDALLADAPPAVPSRK